MMLAMRVAVRALLLPFKAAGVCLSLFAKLPGVALLGAFVLLFLLWWGPSVGALLAMALIPSALVIAAWFMPEHWVTGIKVGDGYQE